MTSNHFHFRVHSTRKIFVVLLESINSCRPETRHVLQNLKQIKYTLLVVCTSELSEKLIFDKLEGFINHYSTTEGIQ